MQLASIQICLLLKFFRAYITLERSGHFIFIVNFVYLSCPIDIARDFSSTWLIAKARKIQKKKKNVR